MAEVTDKRTGFTVRLNSEFLSVSDGYTVDEIISRPLTWRERLLSWPWRPWRKYAMVWARTEVLAAQGRASIPVNRIPPRI